MADLHDSTEHYLATIFEIEEERVDIKRARIAERLKISAPSVTEHIHRMEKQGLVSVSKNNSVSLTPEGRIKAATVVRRHRLAERLLVDVLGLDWSKAHNEADRWEHVISDEVEKHLVKLLGNPETCPHGNPIPNADGTHGNAEEKLNKKIAPLTDSSESAKVIIRRIGESIEVDKDALTFVADNQLMPGEEIQVISLSFENVEVLTPHKKKVQIATDLAKSIFVETN